MPRTRFTALDPQDIMSLQQATCIAIASISASKPSRQRDRESIAIAVLNVASSGFATTYDGTIDATDLAEAAVIRFRNDESGITPHKKGDVLRQNTKVE